MDLFHCKFMYGFPWFGAFSLYVFVGLYITLTYVTLCRNLLWQWCLKSIKARLLSTHLFPPSRYMYVSLYLVASFSIHVVYMSLIHYFIWNWHICYFIQAPSEAPVREEHQVGDPPLTSHQVCLCITFFVCLCIAFSDLVLEETQISDPPVPLQCICIFVDIDIYIYFYATW